MKELHGESSSNVNRAIDISKTGYFFLSLAQYFERMKWISIQFSVTSKDDVTALCNAQILFKNKQPSVLLSNFDSIHKVSKLGWLLWFYNILLSKGFRIYFNFNFNGCKRVEDVNSYSTLTKSILCYKRPSKMLACTWS